jgi:hypothetical protein
LIIEYGGVKMFIVKTQFMNELIDRDFEFYQYCYNFMDIEYKTLRKTQMSHVEIVNLSEIKVMDDGETENIEEVRAFGTYIFFWVNQEELEKELKGALRNIGLFDEKLKP